MVVIMVVTGHDHDNCDHYHEIQTKTGQERKHLVEKVRNGILPPIVLKHVHHHHLHHHHHHHRHFRLSLTRPQWRLLLTPTLRLRARPEATLYLLILLGGTISISTDCHYTHDTNCQNDNPVPAHSFR